MILIFSLTYLIVRVYVSQDFGSRMRESVDVTLSLIYLVGPLLTELIMGSELATAWVILPSI